MSGGAIRFPSTFAALAAAMIVFPLAHAPGVRADETLSLADAVRIASGEAPAVELAKLDEAQARSQRAGARGVLFPSFSATASDFNRTFSLKAQGLVFSIPGVPPFPDPLGPVESFDARLHASQALVDIAGIQRIRAADLKTRRVGADRTATAESAAQAAAAAYLRAARAQATLAARQGDERIATDLLSLAEAQQQAGTAPMIDRTRARTALAGAHGQVLVAQNQLDRALIDLARTLGKPPGEKLALSDTLGSDLARSDAPEVAETATGVAIERRPELAAQQAREAGARAERSAIASERLPRVDASADWGLSGMYAAHAVDTRAFGVALSMPFFDGGRREARIAEQTSTIEQARVRAHDLRDEIAAEVQGALLDLSSAREQIAVADERLALAQEELDEARERFVSGVAGNVEVINAQASLVDARDTEIEARYAFAAARIALARATGVARTLR